MIYTGNFAQMFSSEFMSEIDLCNNKNCKIFVAFVVITFVIII